ncbi:hypothetical protein HPE45_26010 [Escherichia coli]|nr:hypothetical protein [Escherichia coli]
MNEHQEIELLKIHFSLLAKSKIVGLSGRVSADEIYTIQDEDIGIIVKFLSCVNIHPTNNKPPLIIGPSLNTEEELAFRQLKMKNQVLDALAYCYFIQPHRHL